MEYVALLFALAVIAGIFFYRRSVETRPGSGAKPPKKETNLEN